MYSTGNRHLDITGLSCRDPLSSFVNKYPRISKFLGSWGKPDNLKGRIDGGGGVPIGYGEAIYFSNYPNSITLEINDFFAD